MKMLSNLCVSHSLNTSLQTVKRKHKDRQKMMKNEQNLNKNPG